MFPRITSRSKVTEVDSLVSRVLKLFGKYDFATDVFLSTLIGVITGFWDELTGAINRQEDALGTIAEADELRDTKFQDLYYLLQGLTHYPEDDVKLAAKEMFVVFRDVGLSIIHESYSVESGFIYSLLDDFAEAKYADNLILLPGVSTAITELRAAQEAFENLIVDEQFQEVGESDERIATEIKGDILDEVNDKLVPYLAGKVVENGEVYKAFADGVFAFIKKNNDRVRDRLKREEERDE